MTAQRRSQKIVDPTVSDQAGRMMEVDPKGSINVSRKEEIRRKAYELYEKRGKGDGHDLEDWISAESEMQKKSEGAA